MPNIRITDFKGIVPMRDPHLLTPNFACKAVDVDLRNGSLSGWHEPKEVISFDDAPCKVVKRDCCWITAQSPCAEIINVQTCLKTIISEPKLLPKWDFFRKDCSEADYCPVGVPVPVGEISLIASETCTENTESRQYLITFENKWFQEGVPGGISNAVLVETCGATVTLNDIPQPPPGWCVEYINIYRLHSTWDISTGFRDDQAGTSPSGKDGGEHLLGQYNSIQTDADWFFVARVPVGTDFFVDTVETEDLGDLLTSWDYYPTIPDLSIVGETEVGSLVGWIENEVWFSERLTYHAWPFRARIHLDDNIKSIEISGDTLTVFTDSSVYTILDNAECDDANCRTVKKLPIALPLCSKQAITEYRGGYIVASSNGLFVLGPEGGVTNVSEGFFSVDQWKALNPSSMRLQVWDNRLFFSTSNYSGIMQFGENASLTQLSIAPADWFIGDDQLLYILMCGKVYEWGAGSKIMPYEWRSVPVNTTGLRNLAAIQVSHSCPNHASKVFLSVDVDGRNRVSRSVEHGRPWRTGRISGTQFQIQVNSDDTIWQVHLGSSIADLGNA